MSRRTALKALGLGAGGFGATAVLAPASWRLPARNPGAIGTLTVDAWRATLGQQVYIAHRGSGDVFPEHTMVAYQGAVDWGATCLEISVAMTSDGVLICMHDPTFDRTTNGTGVILDQPSSMLDTLRVWQPQLGSAWTDDPPPIPLFEDVLRRFGGRVMLCVEAKVDECFEPMIAMITELGLSHAVIVKGHFSGTDLYHAQAIGYPIFSYFGSVDEVTREAIVDVGHRLNPLHDVLVLPGLGSQTSPYIPDRLVSAAVSTGVPVWVHPLHRRSDAAHFFDLGVQGAICSSYGYIAGVTTAVQRDAWSTRRIAPGEMSKSPGSLSYAPSFTPAGELLLAAKGVPHFLTLGQFSPVPTATQSYTIDVDVSWPVLPAELGDSVSIAFGHDDDRYYQQQMGAGTGYHLILRVNGELALYLHRDRETAGHKLADAVKTKSLAAGEWAHLRIEVSPDRIVARRTDIAASIVSTDTTTRGGYLHIGRSSMDGTAAFRGFTVG